MTSFDTMVDRIPPPGTRRVSMRVTPAAERKLRAGHPWVYDRAIRRQSHAGAPGDLAAIYDGRNRFLAVGLYDPASSIRVRVLQTGRPVPIARPWFVRRLQDAARVRLPLSACRTTGYRLAHGENDGLPGVVVDRYDDILVVKLYTNAWIPHLAALREALRSVHDPAWMVLRFGRSIQAEAERRYGLWDGVTLDGRVPGGQPEFREYGLHFEVDPVHGQKTGFFLDQRENRAKLGTFCAARTVLDAFAYTGACSVYAARGGAREVTSLDVSRPALAVAQRNMMRNRGHPAIAAAGHQVIAADAFEALRHLRRAGRRFDIVVLDPPSFAKTEDEVPRALKAYARLVRLGLGVLQTGGTLMAASCSSHVSSAAFFLTVRQAAAGAKRPLWELERTGHPLDHPVTFPEGAYLKCLFAVAA
ncbi:MAG TPA: class I SAM-dependent methyltransferase [bacterium]